MIIDTLANAATHAGLGPRFARALEHLANLPPTAPLGTVELDGRRLFYTVQEYRTKQPADGFWEAHRAYIDVQALLSGSERVGWAPIGSLKSGHYDSVSDLTILKGDGDFVTLSPRRFLIFFPWDAHMPGMAIDESLPVKKVVFKIAVADS